MCERRSARQNDERCETRDHSALLSGLHADTPPTLVSETNGELVSAGSRREGRSRQAGRQGKKKCWAHNRAQGRGQRAEGKAQGTGHRGTDRPVRFLHGSDSHEDSNGDDDLVRRAGRPVCPHGRAGRATTRERQLEHRTRRRRREAGAGEEDRQHQDRRQHHSPRARRGRHSAEPVRSRQAHPPLHACRAGPVRSPEAKADSGPRICRFSGTRRPARRFRATKSASRSSSSRSPAGTGTR